MRFLFLTIQLFESDFYGEVGSHLVARGHEVTHVTVSRRSARRLRERGFEAVSLLDRMERIEPADLAEEIARIEREYEIESVTDVYRTDVASASLSPAASATRTVGYFRALETLFGELRPDVVVPEVGSETPRTAAHAIASRLGVPTLFLFYTIFPRPLRLYEDTMHAPIVPEEEIRPLAPAERAEVESFIADYTSRAQPIRAHRHVGITMERVRRAGAYVVARLGEDRNNDYLRPGHWAADHARQLIRRARAKSLYRSIPSSPFVYFPLHVVDDYKIERVIPHLADQTAIVERAAAALPEGYELVLKEHPLSIGRNTLTLLRGLSEIPRVRLVDPHTNTHDLIERSKAVAVISSTVGLEALLYRKPVLTIGRPFYAGYGITVDVDSTDGVADAMRGFLEFQPDEEAIARFLHAAMRRCLPGAPVLVDASSRNAERLATTLSSFRASRPGRPSAGRAPAALGA
ncbi:MAG TPA: hypothetical protein VNI55_11075 [Gaiellaceae bacterium]|nr:hypothetical protein [Gaiellaceae bacterium]